LRRGVRSNEKNEPNRERRIDEPPHVSLLVRRPDPPIANIDAAIAPDPPDGM
jgi:hypothetical protein